MVGVTSLLVPILLSAVIVFVASSIIHMVLTYHRGDYARFAKEDALLDALRGLDIPPGDYVCPHAGSPEAMKSPEFQEKMKKGPIVIMTVAPGGSASMGKSLTQWFLYSVLVGLLTAFAAGAVLPPGESYHEVFHLVAITSFMGYSLALLQGSIWYKRGWGATLRSVFDGAIYGLLTGGTFGWLWPR
jgi:Flp pilus assembly protein TadB